MAEAGGKTMAGPKVFVSYAGDERAFVENLVLALRDKGFTPSFGAELEAEQTAAIAACDALVLVLTAESAASPRCASDVEFAAGLHKRLAAVTPRPLAEAPAAPAIAALKPIPFYKDPAVPGSDWYPGLLALVGALREDGLWARERKHYLERAKKWGAGFNYALLRPEELDNARRWLAAKPADETTPAEITTFIDASLADEQRRVRTHDAPGGEVASAPPSAQQLPQQPPPQAPRATAPSYGKWWRVLALAGAAAFTLLIVLPMAASFLPLGAKGGDGLDAIPSLRIEPYEATMYAAENEARVYSAARLNAALLEKLPLGARVAVTGRTELVGSLRWYRIKGSDGVGYVRGDMLSVTRPALTRQPRQQQTTDAPVDATAVPRVEDEYRVQAYRPATPLYTQSADTKVRALPRLDASPLARLPAGAELPITGRTVADGKVWYRVALRGGGAGWVRADVVTDRRGGGGAVNRPTNAVIDKNMVDWLRRPSGEELAAYFPEGPAPGDQAIAVRCLVQPDGRLDDCLVLNAEAHSPAYVRAAYRAVRGYRIRPTLSDGSSAVGRPLELTFRFS